jgi:CubicO group peptidase (beta-lactamase class C family)
MRIPRALRSCCRRNRATLLACGIVFGAVVGISLYAGSLVSAGFLETSTGFAAKVAASAVFVSGRSLESVYEQELAPDGFLEKAFRFLLSINVNRDEQSVTASVLGVERTAVFREGYGCTLAIGRTVDDLRAEVSGAGETRPQSQPWETMGDDGERRFDRDALEAAIGAAFQNQKIKTRAVVVIQDGRLIGERYAAGFNAGMPLPGWSMTKSVTHALVGIRVRQGRMRPDAPLALNAWQEADNPRAAITLDQMLRMSSGLQWDEESPDHTSDTTRMLFRERSMADFAAQAPVAAAPGKRWVYSSGTTNLICEALRYSFDVDGDYREFPRRELFDPIGMTSAVFELDASGTFVGSSYCFATARDWARFGQLYLDDGVVNGKRILPEGWVAGAAEPTRGSKRRYGRHFWLPRDKTLPPGTFLCRGFEGQLLAIVPEKRMVIVRLGSTRDRKAWDPDAFIASIVNALPSEPDVAATPWTLEGKLLPHPRHELGPRTP